MSINGGGGVYNYGSATLTVDGCYLTRNRATEKGGGIYNDWMAGVKDTLLGANRGSLGGGIFNQWSLAITRSTFINNQGEAGGGGIYNDRDLALTESSLISNAAAAASGGGILLSANSNAVSIQRTTVASNTANTDGGGVYVGSTSQAIPITNTTVSGNFAGNDGGGIFFVGMNTLDLYNVTVAYNSADRSQMGAQGGGIYANGTLMTMNNTLVGNNTRWISGDAHADCYQLACTVTADNSLVENDGPSGNGCLESGGSANILGEDPVLAILTDNGGPTWTHGLRERSPAVDAGRIVNAPPIDQRGNSRPDGLAYDIGAFEGTVPSWARFLPALLKD